MKLRCTETQTPGNVQVTIYQRRPEFNGNIRENCFSSFSSGRKFIEEKYFQLWGKFIQLKMWEYSEALGKADLVRKAVLEAAAETLTLPSRSQHYTLCQHYSKLDTKPHPSMFHTTTGGVNMILFTISLPTLYPSTLLWHMCSLRLLCGQISPCFQNSGKQ